jgi:hypothetical protein
MTRIQSVILVAVLVLTNTLPGYAQVGYLLYLPYLEQAQLRLGNSQLSYSYDVVLKNEKTGKTIDSISGRLLKYRKSFMDSNRQSMVFLHQGVLVKADHQRKTALVCDIGKVQKMMGLQPEDFHASYADIPDSMINRISEITTRETGDRLEITYTIRPGNGALKSLLLVFNRKDMNLLSLEMVLADTEMSGYEKKYRIFGIRTDSSLPTKEQYVLIEKGKATLTGSMKNYTLNTIL